MGAPRIPRDPATKHTINVGLALTEAQYEKLLKYSNKIRGRVSVVARELMMVALNDVVDPPELRGPTP